MLEKPHWSEEDSAGFITQGRAFTPDRDGVIRAFLDLTPAEPGEAFTVVDVATGAGWLTEAYLRAFPHARAIALDGSETMRRHVETSLSAFADRLSVLPFELAEAGWERALSPARAIVSSLAIHHLDGGEKRDLYARLFDVLEPGGALLIFDLAAPASQHAWRHAAREWDHIVARQSRELIGSDQLFDEFRETQWNYYEHPDDPIDQPSAVTDHLRWLAEAGFSGVDVFRMHAGHVLYGGYRPK